MTARPPRLTYAGVRQHDAGLRLSSALSVATSPGPVALSGQMADFATHEASTHQRTLSFVRVEAIVTKPTTRAHTTATLLPAMAERLSRIQNL